MFNLLNIHQLDTLVSRAQIKKKNMFLTYLLSQVIGSVSESPYGEFISAPL